MSFNKDDSAGFLANHLARLFARELQLRIKPLGLSTGTFPALLVLWESDGMTQRELIERLDIEQPTMANTLARMERDGLIDRRKDPADGRVQRIWLTAAARAQGLGDGGGRGGKRPGTGGARTGRARGLPRTDPQGHRWSADADDRDGGQDAAA